MISNRRVMRSRLNNAATIAAAATMTALSPADASISLPYAFYDDLRASSGIVFAPLVGNDDDEASTMSHVGRNLHSISNSAAAQSSALTLCHVPTFFRWSQKNEEEEGGYVDVSSEAYGGTAAALLAIHHFNNGIPMISPALDGIHTKCQIRLTMETVDSQSSGILAVRELTRLVTRSPNDVVEPQPCAILGSSWSGTTKKMATNTGVYDLLQVTPSASSVALDNMGEYPLFTRTHPSDASMAELSVDYLHHILNIKFFGQLYIDNDFGSTYHNAVVKRAAEHDMVVKSVSFRPGAEIEEIEAGLVQLKETGYAYFLGIFFGGDYERIMDKAAEIGVAGEGRLWMFNGALASAFVNGETLLGADSKAAAATFGSAIIHDEGGLPGLPQFDKFLEEWRKIPSDEGLVQYINSKQPLPPAGSDINFARGEDYFRQPPSHIAAFSYDAIVGLGLSACQALEDQGAGDAIFSGADHHAAFVKSQFKGASGDVIFSSNSFSRNATSTYHIMSNILPVGEVGEDGLQAYKATPKVFYDTGTQKWVAISHEDASDFVYSDGTNDPPAEIPELDHNMNDLQPGVRVACLTLCAVAMLMAVGFLVFTFVQRKNQVIKAAQPPFLMMLCIGCLLMASTIIPASMDDSVASTKGCSIACMSKVWLFACGFCICFSALFSKLHRINKLFKNAKGFKRVKVTTKDVILPFFTLLCANFVVLATWTALAPLQWERTILAYDNYDRPMSSIGTCSSEKSTPFSSTLIVINGFALILALWQAYQARNITTEFSESKHIAMAMVCIFQSLFFGVPVMIIVEGQPTPELFTVSAIVFIIVIAMLLLIFIPKIVVMRKGREGLPKNYNPIGSVWLQSTMRSKVPNSTKPEVVVMEKSSISQSRPVTISGLESCDERMGWADEEKQEEATY